MKYITSLLLATILVLPNISHASSTQTQNVTATDVTTYLHDYVRSINSIFDHEINSNSIALLLSETDKLYNWLSSVSDHSDDTTARNLASAIVSQL